MFVVRVNQMENERFQVPPGMSGGAVGPGMMSPQQALFMQQQGMGGARGPFPNRAPAVYCKAL